MGICMKEDIFDDGTQHQSIDDDNNNSCGTITQHPKPFLVESGWAEGIVVFFNTTLRHCHFTSLMSHELKLKW